MQKGGAALLLALLVGACNPMPCRAKTLHLTLDYSGVAASADALTIDVTVGDLHQRYTRARTPGQTRDTLEVVFAAYPAQAPIAVAATATAGGQTVGAGQAVGTLAPSCTAMALALTTGAAAGVDGGALLADLSAGATDGAVGLSALDDLAMTTPFDLASSDLAVTAPTIAFAGETDTELHPNGGNGTLPFDTHCANGYAIVGFAFALATDGNGVTTGINRADALCVAPLVTPKSGGGFTVTWDPNRASQIPGIGTSAPDTVQYLCQMPSYLVGFAGRAGASSLDELILSCAPILVASDDSVSLGPTVDGTSGVGSTSNGAAFGPVHCPAGQIVTSVLSSGAAGAPPLSFGFGCSTLSAH
jgi:hypothetical protein